MLVGGLVLNECVNACVCVVDWNAIQGVFPGIDSGSTTTLTRIKQLLSPHSSEISLTAFIISSFLLIFKLHANNSSGAISTDLTNQ